jgi:K(+)-stimulated pyrophosphate-energized sodium pump
MTLSVLLIIALGALSIAYGVVTAKDVLGRDPGTARMQEISRAIQEGASAYLRRQYTTIGIVGAVLFVLILAAFGFGGHAFAVGIGFLIGALLSGAAGLHRHERLGARQCPHRAGGDAVAGRGPRRRVQVGRHHGDAGGGPRAARRRGYFLILVPIGGAAPNSRLVIDALVALGFGASLISIFARLGGGIFTKGADVGGDMVGKVEAGIPEDDPRNPATIADNVGDNVGDCAGMAADLFETYAVTMVATMVLAAISFGPEFRVAAMLFPLAIGAVCVVTSIAGTYFVKLPANNSIMGAMYRGLIVTGALSLAVLLPLAYLTFGTATVTTTGGVAFGAFSLFLCGAVGLAVTAAIVWVTEYYTGTDYRPVRAIAEASQTGHGTNVIRGLAVSMESTALPALIIIAGVLSSYGLAGLYGIAIAVTTMLALAGMVVALDAFGPVTDNAAASPRCRACPPRSATPRTRWTRWATPPRPSPRATRSARRAGRAGAVRRLHAGPRLLQANPTLYPYFAGIAALTFSLADPYVVVGLLFGGLLPFLFGGMAMTAVGRAARAWWRRCGGSSARSPASCRAPTGPTTAGGGPADQGGDQGDDHPLAAAGALAARGLLRDPADRRQGGGLLGAGRHAARRHRHRLLRRGLHDHGRRRLGQRQEVHRGGPLRRQGVGGPQGGGDRRHRGRPLQGHGRPGGEPDDQDHQHRGAAAAGDPGARLTAPHHLGTARAGGAIRRPFASGGLGQSRRAVISSAGAGAWPACLPSHPAAWTATAWRVATSPSIVTMPSACAST